MAARFSATAGRLSANLVLAILLALTPCLTRADEDTEALNKIAEQLVEGYEWFAEDFKELKGKPPQERLNFVLEQGNKRAWDKGKEMLYDTVKEKGPEYAKEFFRQQAFREMALRDLPLIIKAYGGVKTEAWQKLDEKMNAQVTARMGPVTSAFTAWNIKDDYLDPVVTAWAEGDYTDGLKELEKIGLGKLGEYAIPGYGWIALGAKVVMVSGDLLVGWINDFKRTAVLEGMYPALKKGASPDERGEFARSLVQRDQHQVSQEVKSRYNDFCQEGVNPLCIGYVDYFQQKANEEAGKNAMDGILAEVLHDVLELRRKFLEDQAKAKAQYDERDRVTKQQAEAAFAPIKAKSKEIKALVSKKQNKIDEIRKAFESAKASMVKQGADKASAKFSAQPKGAAGVQFQAVGQNAVQVLKQTMSLYTAVGAGQDTRQAAQAFADAQKKDQEALASANKKNEEILALNTKQISAAYEAQTKGVTDPSVLKAASDTYSRLMKNEVEIPRENIYKAAALYATMVEAQEAAIRQETQDEISKKMQGLAAVMRPLQAQAQTSFQSASELFKSTREQLNALPGPDEYDTVVNHAQFITSQMRDYQVLNAEEPGKLYNTLFLGLQRAQQGLDEQKTVIEQLVKPEEDATKKLKSAVDMVRARFQAVVPKDLQYQYDWNNPNYVQLELGVKPMQGPLSQVVCCDNIRYSLEVPSGGLVKRHKEKIDQIDKFIENLEPLMNADFAAARIIAMIPHALDVFSPYIGLDMDKEKIFAQEQFEMLNGVVAPGIEPAKSDAVKYLQDMKKAWDGNRAYVEKLMVHRKSRGSVKTLLKYWRNDPASFYAAIDRMAQIPEKIKLYTDLLAGFSKAGGSPAELDIKQMYKAFAEAYEGKSMNTLMRFLGRDWETEDGTSRAELEQNLRNNFRVFDSIQFKMEGLSITGSGQEFTVSYSVNMTGKIRQLNATHEEKSTVKDTVTITSEGPRIVKTSGGRIWMK